MRELSKAKAILRERRDMAQREFERKKSLLLQDENFAEKVRKLSATEFEISRRKVYGLEYGELVEERENLKKSIDAILKENGDFDIDNPSYQCKICNDTGYVKSAHCECLEKLRIELTLESNPALKGVAESLKEVNYNFYGDKSADYAKYGKFLHNNFLRGEVNYCTIIGAPGTGKTYLSEVCLNQALREGYSVAEINSVKLNRVFLEYHCARLENKAEIWEELVEPDILLIDDLGVESLLNNVTVQYIYELLTERAGKKTVITTNLDLRGLEDKYGQRIVSRLLDKRKGSSLSLSGEDYRI